MAEEPGDDRESRESTASEPDGSKDADGSGGESPEERAVDSDDAGNGAPDDPDASGASEEPDGSKDADDYVDERDVSESEYFIPPDGDPDSEDAILPDDDAGFETAIPADEESTVATDDDFNTLNADAEDDDQPGEEHLEPTGDDEAGGDLSEAYGVPSSTTTDEEQARWAGESTTPDDEAEADAPASDGGYAGESDPYATYDDYELGEGGEMLEGAPDDQEMPLADHIEEMVKRLGIVVVVMAVVSGIVFPFGEDLINLLWYSYLPGTVEQCPGAAATAQDLGPGDAACPRVYHPLAVILARLKVATLAGFLVALPVFVYQTYLFMRPGLYPKERRYYLASVPTSLVLAAVGVAFAHFLVIPAIFTYFVYYSDSATTIAFGLAETFDLMILLMGGFAIVFQIPLFIMLALMMGLVTRQWMADRRLIFWGVYAGLAFLFSPDPTGMAPIIVAATMISLHEGTLLLAKWTGRK